MNKKDECTGNKLYIPADDIYFQDLFNWKDPLEKCKTTVLSMSPGERCKLVRRKSNTSTGKLVECNKDTLAVFRYDSQVFAVAEQCPHAGGPLHLGDIEDIAGSGLCVKCPWHSWRYSLSTGHVISPKGHKGLKLTLYPVKIKTDGRILIGFDSFASDLFSGEDNF